LKPLYGVLIKIGIKFHIFMIHASRDDFVPPTVLSGAASSGDDAGRDYHVNHMMLSKLSNLVPHARLQGGWIAAVIK
jgi:hypothetical protein